MHYFLEKKFAAFCGEKNIIYDFLPHFLEKYLFQSHFWKKRKKGVFLRRQSYQLF